MRALGVPPPAGRLEPFPVPEADALRELDAEAVPEARIERRARPSTAAAVAAPPTATSITPPAANSTRRLLAARHPAARPGASVP